MSYRQLTEGQRYQISLLLSQNNSRREIAKQIGVAPSTICRELRRNSIKPGIYKPGTAYERALARRKAKSRQVSDETETALLFMLSLDWSPEQISAICKRIGRPVSHEWIYKLVLTDYENGGKLYKHLRHQLKRIESDSRSPRGASGGAVRYTTDLR
jgi:IS30 family transposase